MRARASLVVVSALASCGVPAAPRQTVFPTLEATGWPETPSIAPEPVAFNSRVVALRTSLGRAAIGLEMRGANQLIRLTSCDEPDAQREQRGCARCELAGDGDELDGDVLDAVTAAFDAYPARALEATHIEHVALCKKLTFINEPDDHAIGTVDLHARRLFVSVAPFLGKHYDAEGAVTTDDIVHHELFHLLEHERMPYVYKGDAEWSAHNSEAFVYMPDAIDEPRRAGFINSYAATAETEDRASVFQYLMARSSELCAVAAGDEEVRAKTRIVWRRAAAFLGEDVLREHAPCVTAWLDAAASSPVR